MPPKALVATIVLGSLLIAIAMIVSAWQLGASRRAKAAVTKDEEYRRLADEYRRIANLALTAQERTDVKLGQITSQLTQLHDQVDSVQKILKDVE